MGLLVTLNEEGYQTLKKDREVIIENVYVGSVFVVPGDKAVKRRIKFVINSVSQYKDINDERLLEDAKKIARDELIKFFPTYFE